MPHRHIQRVMMSANTVGGVWTYALELARGLSRHGVRVLLATLGRAPDAAQQVQAAQCRDYDCATAISRSNGSTRLLPRKPQLATGC